MIATISGGRNYHLSNEDIQKLKEILLEKNITEVNTGKAWGVDSESEQIAREIGLKVNEFPADWGDMSPPCHSKINVVGKAYNALAGFKRNEEMAKRSNLLILFPGGKGTKHMYDMGVKYNLEIINFMCWLLILKRLKLF